MREVHFGKEYEFYAGTFMYPRISWDSTKTISRGNEVCDFRLRLSKRHSK